MFLTKEFEYGGTLGNLKQDKGNYLGVYIIVLPNDFGEIGFDENYYKTKYRKNGNEKDLNYPLYDLKQKLVNNSNILYIGKSKSKTMQKRMIEHIKLYTWDENNDGYNNVPARGGRSIGQIRNFKNLEVWYLESNNPDKTEKELLDLFQKQYKKLPFANRRH